MVIGRAKLSGRRHRPRQPCALRSGTLKSTIRFGMLLWSGIGGTIRMSRSADPVEAVKASLEMLKALNLRRRGVTVISCPSCGHHPCQHEAQWDQIRAKATAKIRLDAGEAACFIALARSTHWLDRLLCACAICPCPDTPAGAMLRPQHGGIRGMSVKINSSRT